MLDCGFVQGFSLNENIIRKTFSKTVFNLFTALYIGEKR